MRCSINSNFETRLLDTDQYKKYACQFFLAEMHQLIFMLTVCKFYTNVIRSDRSLTDQQLFLSMNLFLENSLPVNLSAMREIAWIPISYIKFNITRETDCAVNK